jgi:hypothetical protein
MISFHPAEKETGNDERASLGDKKPAQVWLKPTFANSVLVA